MTNNTEKSGLDAKAPASNIGLAIAVKYLKGAPGIYLAKEISDAITAERKAALSALPHTGVSEEMLTVIRQHVLVEASDDELRAALEAALSSQQEEAAPVAWEPGGTVAFSGRGVAYLPPEDDILDRVAAIRDAYLKLQGDALDQMELHAAQGDARETSAFSSEAERHGAAILACRRVLAILEASPVPPDAGEPSKGHTPTPWDAMEDPRGRLIHVETSIDNPAGAGLPVCSIPAKRKADALFIVAACNAASRSADVPATSKAKGSEDIAAALSETCDVLETLVDPDSQHVSSATIWAQAIAASRKGRAALARSKAKEG